MRPQIELDGEVEYIGFEVEDGSIYYQLRRNKGGTLSVRIATVKTNVK